MGPPGRRDRRRDAPRDSTEEDENNNDVPEQVAPEVSSTLRGPPGNLRAHLLPPSSVSSSTYSSALQHASPQPEAGPSRIITTFTAPAPAPTPASPSYETSPATSTFPRVQSGSDEEVPPEGHIPRAPNAFILFRSHLIRTEAIPKSVEGKNKDLSKIIGAVWQGLTTEERGHWEREAQEAQRVHRLRYPDWRFAPGIQLGDVSASKRRKRKADFGEGGDGSTARRKTRKVKGKQPVAAGVSGSDSGKSKGKQKMKEEDVSESSPSPVIYAPTLPMPYSFSIPLHPPTGQSRAIRPIPARREKAQSLPLSNIPSSPPRRRVTAEDAPASSPSPPQAPQSSTAAGHSPQPGPSTESELEQAHECSWTGHELEQEGSPHLYLDTNIASPQVSQHSPYHYFSTPPPAAHSLPSQGFSHDHSNTFYSYSPSGHPPLLPPPMVSPPQYDPSLYTHMPSPLGEVADFDFPQQQQAPQSNMAVPLTERYRRGSIDLHTRSPLSQSHTFNDLVGGSGSSTSMSGDQSTSWPSFSQMLRYPTSVPVSTSSWTEPQPSTSSPTHGPDMTFGGAVSGGTPLGYGGAQSSSPLASGYPFPTHHAYHSSPSELSHALDDPSSPTASSSAHDLRRHQRTESEGS
ncbi:hypothetical protein DL96DRAFT_1219992 [Flagelloscypha sp. PMI_526]|nr:hypothetical protein DL96DRAFT_1219992 [Flagelloscypha sp. PMI_526]